MIGFDALNPTIHQNYASTKAPAIFSFTGSGLYYRASNSWGQYNKAGYGGHVFPTVIGETGSQLEVQGDIQFYNSLIPYVNVRLSYFQISI